MKILDPNKARQLRAMIAKTLDKASTDAEKQGSAFGVVRLLAEFGLGVDSESIDPEKTEQLVLVLPSELPSSGPQPYIPIQDLFEDLFGAAWSTMNDMEARQRQRRATAAAEAEQRASEQKVSEWYAREHGRPGSYPIPTPTKDRPAPVPFGGQRRKRNWEP